MYALKYLFANLHFAIPEIMLNLMVTRGFNAISIHRTVK